MDNIILTPEHLLALKKMKEPEGALFVTGKAGSGKSTLLRYFQQDFEGSAAYVAPTGVAALNMGGMTIHSFFGFPANVTQDQALKMRVRNPQLYKALKVLVIDEISMVRADLLDAIDIFLRRFGPSRSLPFGGVKMIWFGDLYQLPPVVTASDYEWMQHQYPSPYFFNSQVFKLGFTLDIIELKQIFRQTDPEFISFLNRVRTKTVDVKDLEWLRKSIKIGSYGFGSHNSDLLFLTTTNKKADSINQMKMKSLSGSSVELKGLKWGDVDNKELPTDEIIVLKEKAQVMLLNNDPDGQWVNGSMGHIEGWTFKDLSGAYEIKVVLNTKKTVIVTPFEWEYFQFEWDPKEFKVISKKRGTFRQYPIKLAWALTIHKSQGLTFDQIHIDFDRGTFAHGQAYVALSRCRTPQGLSLERPLRFQDIRLDDKVIDFFNRYKVELNEFNLNETNKAFEANKIKSMSEGNGVAGANDSTDTNDTSGANNAQDRNNKSQNSNQNNREVVNKMNHLNKRIEGSEAPGNTL